MKRRLTREHEFPPFLALWVLCLGGMLTLVAVLIVGSAQLHRGRTRFEMASRDAEEHLRDRLRLCEDLLLAVQGHIQASGGVNRYSFRVFLESMEIKSRFPGLLGVAYGVPLAPAGAEAVQRRLQMEHGRSDLRIHPGTGYGDDAIVLFEEPELPNIRALGFNSASAPDQRVSLLAARDSGQIRASAPMALAQAPERGPGLILRLGVYRGGRVPDAVEARRLAFAGYANGIFLLDDLTRDSMQGLPRGIQLRIADATDPSSPMAVSQGGAPGSDPWWSLVSPPLPRLRRSFGIGGRVWELDFAASPAFFEAGEVGLPWFVGLAGLQATLLLAALVHAMARTGRQARALADRMTRELHQSESRLRAIAQVLPDVILVVDDEGCYREVLTGDPSLLAAPVESLLGHNISEALPPELSREVLEVIRRTLALQQLQDVEYSLETPLGHRRFDARVAPLDLTIEGRPCVLWAARDITEHRAQEESLRQAQRLEGLGVLAGGIAHDFNNLLAAIMGYVNLSRIALEGGGDPARHLAKAEASIERAADLARQLLAYSGRASFRLESMDLNAKVLEMNELLAVSRSKKVSLELRLAPSLPFIEGDPVQLQQVVMNLVTNAGESFGDDPGRVAVRTGTSELDAIALKHRFAGQSLQPGCFVFLEVEDEGCGMGPELLERIFDPFFTTKPAGRGLGLSAIRGILRTHRAGIEIVSQPGEGTTIGVYFPAAQDALLPGTVSAAVTSTVPLTGLLLLAEDEPALRETAQQMLERLGMEVLVAADGEEAWSLFQAHREQVSIALLDLTMPRRSGVEVYGLIRSVAPDLPVIICSGFSREAMPELKDASERRVFLAKPYTFEQLEQALRKVLGG
ncbi:CHASE domain-containing protein [Holophaga foetida]|uniref:CHASE domain-containing protein n=1 Tax=Holophaga foetida TaxID=35839 RepID=UPI0002474D6D|nr:CHASE domain-containing protein [Holophaga foetida]